MSKKDIDYTLRPIKFIDDPYYFLGKAIGIRKERKKFEKKKESINEEIERLRLFKRRIGVTEQEAKDADAKIASLIEKRKRKFETAFRQKAAGDNLENQCLKVERNIHIAQKTIAFPFKTLYRMIKK